MVFLVSVFLDLYKGNGYIYRISAVDQDHLIVRTVIAKTILVPPLPDERGGKVQIPVRKYAVKFDPLTKT